MSEVLFLGCSVPLLFRLYQRAHIAATRGTEYVVYMFQSLAHAETAEENNLLRRKKFSFSREQKKSWKTRIRFSPSC